MLALPKKLDVHRGRLVLILIFIAAWPGCRSRQQMGDHKAIYIRYKNSNSHREFFLQDGDFLLKKLPIKMNIAKSPGSSAEACRVDVRISLEGAEKNDKYWIYLYGCDSEQKITRIYPRALYHNNVCPATQVTFNQGQAQSVIVADFPRKNLRLHCAVSPIRLSYAELYELKSRFKFQKSRLACKSLSRKRQMQNREEEQKFMVNLSDVLFEGAK